MAATKAAIGLWRRLLCHLRRRCSAACSASPARRAADLPENQADVLFHPYIGGGVKADGPALLVRKSIFDKVSLSGTYYVDAVSNASIDVVTTASPYKETRHEFGLSADYVYRDAKITFGLMTSHEPDYVANTGSLDVTQEVFGGMTTIAFGFTRGRQRQEVRARVPGHRPALAVPPRHDPDPDAALADEREPRGAVRRGLPRQPVPRRARVRRRGPRAHAAHTLGRAVKLRLVGDLGSRDAMHVEYRYFSDKGDIKAHTAEIGYSRYFGENWLADAFVRYYSQSHALFYSDNATSETTYVTRNRQLSTFNDMGLGAKVAYTLRRVPGRYDLKLTGRTSTRASTSKTSPTSEPAACTATPRTSSRSTCRLLTETAMIKPICKLSSSSSSPRRCRSRVPPTRCPAPRRRARARPARRLPHPLPRRHLRRQRRSPLRLPHPRLPRPPRRQQGRRRPPACRRW